MIAPHGGTLVDRLVPSSGQDELRARAEGLPTLTLNSRESSDLEMIATGAMSPLTGFMTREEYEGVVREMRLPDGTLWPLPVVLSVRQDAPAEGSEVALRAEDGTLLGVMEVRSVWQPDKKAELEQCFRGDEEHPAWAYLQSVGDTYVGGPVQVLELPRHDKFQEYRLTPAETRAAFEEKGWKTIVAFQTRNPIHRAHEYLTKVALEQTDGLLIHPLVGDTKSDDVPSEVRMRCYHVLLEKYYPQERTMLAVYPQAMRYGGPREALLHAICRQNYGCTHIIVGRDHAGVGSYYGTFDAQRIFDEIRPDDLGILTLRFEHAFYCKLTDGMATTKSSPAAPEDRIFLSGTKVREMLARGERPPAEFTRPEVADILIEAYAQKVQA